MHGFDKTPSPESTLSVAMGQHPYPLTPVSSRAFTALFLVASLSSVAPADQIDDLVNAAMKKYGTPGLSVAVIRDGKVIKSKGYGLANVEHNVKVISDTIFELGSVSKMFTASLVMKLVEDGKVKLDESIRT